MKLEEILSVVLRAGLFSSIILMLIGGGLFFSDHANDIVDYRSFKPVKVNIFESELSLALIQSGVLTLLLTPISRVAACLCVFIIDCDILYIFLTSVILFVLCWSFF